MTDAVTQAVDPISIAVTRANLTAVAREIFTVFARTTMLPVLYEVHDFGISLFDDRLNLIADAPGVPEFVGSLDFALAAILDHFPPGSHLQPDDVVISTHPFLTGNHPADASVIAPVFVGERVVGYCGLKAHMGDLGGTDIYPTQSRSVYDEGLLIPPRKLFVAGELNEDLAAVIEANSRLPRETLGNMIAAGAALRMGARKLGDLVTRFGFDVYRAAVDQLLSQGDHEVRRVIAALPDGAYTAVDHLDGDGINHDAVPLVCTVTVDGSDLTVDTTGSAAQQEGPFNSTLPMTTAACRLALKRLTTQDRLQSNSGEHRALRVIAPQGSVFNATPPAATFQMAITAQRLGELVHAALAHAADDFFPTASAGDATFVSGLMTLPSGRLAFFDGMAPIGYGATATEDGMTALFHFPLAGLKVASAEVTEVRSPVMLAVGELCCDSGGPGRFRGGLGTRYEWRALADGVVNLLAEKQTTPAIEGRAGGHAAGQRNAAVVRPGLPTEVRGGKHAQVPIAAGDVIVVEGGSGAGYGDPLLRDPDAVAEDVRQGYVSLAAARSSYGVFLDPETLEIDASATAQARSAAPRPKAGPGHPDPRPELPPLRYLSGREVERLLPPVHDRLALVHETFSAIADGTTEAPPPAALHPRGTGFADAMPAYSQRRDLASLKWISGDERNAGRGLPYISGLIVVNDSETAVPIGILDAAAITAARTAAVSAACIEALAGGDWSDVAIIGYGVQARAHIAVLRTLDPDARIRVATRTPRPDEETDGIEFVDTPRAAIADADVVITGIPLSGRLDPAVEASWLKPGALVMPLDDDASLAASVVGRAELFVVDDLARFERDRQNGSFAGWRAADASVADALATGSRTKALTVCMNQGIGLMDGPFAQEVLTAAQRLDVGSVLER